MFGLWILYYALWVVVIAAVVIIAIGLRGRRQGDERLCRVCGYDLRGLLGVASLAATCPECGASIQSLAAVHIGRRRRRWSWVIAGLAMVLMSLGGLFGVQQWSKRTVVKPYLLVRAIDTGDLDQIGVLVRDNPSLASGESQTGRWPSEQTPLTQAAAAGQRAAVLMLLGAGAEVDGVNLQGRSALHEAVAAGHVDVVRALLDYGADPEVQTTGEGRRVLHTAVLASWRPEVAGTIVPMLLQEGARADGQDASGRSVLHYLSGDISKLSGVPGIPGVANRHEDLSGLVELLALRGADVDAAGPAGDRPLHWSVRHGKTLVTQQLINAGANVDIQNVSGDTPLHEAVRLNDAASVAMLLAAGADLSVRNTSQRTAMQIAAASVTVDRAIIDALVEHGATLSPAMRQRLGLDGE